jgi:zinc protease
LRSRPAILCMLLPAAAVHAQDLPADPRLLTGELENGLRYVVMEHDNPPRRTAVWLYVRTGSLNETDEQRGAAHFLEHMAFNGSERFPPGSVVDFFQRMGMTFGRHQNAATGLDRTTYRLELPDNDPATLDAALAFLADVAFGLTLPAEEVERERGVILEEKRAGMGAMQRVADDVLERLAPGSTLGRRQPIGTEGSIRALTREQLADFYGSWYVPSNMAVLVVADMDPTVVVERVSAALGRGARLPRPASMPVDLPAPGEPFGIVATDAELSISEVAIALVGPPRHPMRTRTDFRARLVERIGIRAFNARVRDLAGEGRATFVRASASASDIPGAARLVQVSAAGEARAWRAMLADLAAELQRARTHGFSEREIERVRGEVRAEAEHARATEPTRPASAILAELSEAEARGEPMMSAEQRMALVAELLPTIGSAEVSAAFSRLFDPAGARFIAQLGPAEDVPAPDELAALALDLLRTIPPPLPDRAAGLDLLPVEPEPGRIVEVSRQEEAEVWSVWLANGARVHHRHMPQRRGEATITITLAGGELLEDVATRGLSQAAARAWAVPATRTLTSAQVRELMAPVKARVAGNAGPDAMTLTVSGSPADLEQALRLAHRLLTDPVVEPAALEQWKREQAMLIAQRGLSPAGAVQEELARALFPRDEPRTRLLESADLDRLDAAAAQAWLELHLAHAPIELSIVGDIDAERAFDLVERYIGSLPPRDRIRHDARDPRRALDRPRGPIRALRDVRSPTPQAFVVCGFYAPDETDVRSCRLLEVASRVLSRRALREVREARGLAYSPMVQLQPGTTYPGLGLFVVLSTTSPGAADELARAFDALLDDLASSGPDEEEMRTVRGQIDTILEEQLREPRFWSQRLRTLDYSGRRLEDIMAARASYAAISTEEVREAMSRFRTPGSRFTVIVRSTGEARGEGAAEP